MERVIKIYTDGGSRNHGNVKGSHVKRSDPAAWAYLIRYPNGVNAHRTGFENGATNNQMELQAPIEAFDTLTNHGVTKVKQPRINVYTDSKYLYNAFAKGWIKKWQKKKFHKVKNAPRWEILLYLINHIASVRFYWIKGHADNDGNNFVDQLLNKKMDDNEPKGS